MLNNILNNILSKIIVEKNINGDIIQVSESLNLMLSNLYCYDQIKYLINNKGKHLRPILALHYFYKYKLNNSYDVNELYKILAIVEITHFASLLHDDVIDNSKTRRFEHSLNYLYGNKNSILIGDYLLVNSFNNLIKTLNNRCYGKYIIDQFIKASSNTAYGAYLENKVSSIEEYSIDNYIKIARLKTGALFKFSCISGCVLSNTNFDNIKQAANFGLVFGIIYQIQNDLDDYKCSNYEDSEDYIQSNITFPIIILQYFTNINKIFYNKNQKNFDKIKKIMNTVEFKNKLNNVVKKYLIFVKNIFIVLLIFK